MSSIKHVTSTLVVKLHVHPLRSNDRPGVEPRLAHTDTPWHKHGRSVDFMRHHYQNTGEMLYTAPIPMFQSAYFSVLHT